FELRNSTIAANRALDSTTGGGAIVLGQGGGYRTLGGSQVNVVSTIFGNNTAGVDPDFSGAFTLAENNLLQHNTGNNLAPRPRPQPHPSRHRTRPPRSRARAATEQRRADRNTRPPARQPRARQRHQPRRPGHRPARPGAHGRGSDGHWRFRGPGAGGGPGGAQ